MKLRELVPAPEATPLTPTFTSRIGKQSRENPESAHHCCLDLGSDRLSAINVACVVASCHVLDRDKVGDHAFEDKEATKHQPKLYFSHSQEASAPTLLMGFHKKQVLTAYRHIACAQLFVLALCMPAWPTTCTNVRCPAGGGNEQPRVNVATYSVMRSMVFIYPSRGSAAGKRQPNKTRCKVSPEKLSIKHPDSIPRGMPLGCSTWHRSTLCHQAELPRLMHSKRARAKCGGI